MSSSNNKPEGEFDFIQRFDAYQKQVGEVVARGIEHPRFELKRTATISKDKLPDRLDFVKLIQGVANSISDEESFIVIGADQKERRFYNVDNLEEFDPASVSSVIAKYLAPAPLIEIFNNMRSPSGLNYVLIVLRINQPRPIVVVTEGKSQIRTHFNVGDVWVKKDTSLRPANRNDIDAMYESAHHANSANITAQSVASNTHFAKQRQIQAVERLWKVLRKFNSEFSPVAFVDSIFTASELDAYFKGGDAIIASFINDYTDLSVVTKKLQNAGTNEPENERPFVTTRLWSIFFALRGLYGRAAFLLATSHKERRLADWRTDNGCDQLLRSVLSAARVAQLQGLKVGGIQAAIASLEEQFLAEAGMNKSH